MKTTTTVLKRQRRGRLDDGWYEYVTYPIARCVDIDTVGRPVPQPAHVTAALDRSMTRTDTFYAPELLNKIGSLSAAANKT